MGLFGKSIKKMQQDGDIDGLVRRVATGLDSRAVAAVATFGPAALPGLLSVLPQGSPNVPAAIAIIGVSAMDGLADVLLSGQPTAQRSAATALLAMAVRGEELNGRSLAALRLSLIHISEPTRPY